MTTPETAELTRGEVLYQPTPDAARNFRMGTFLTDVEQRHGLKLAGYQGLWEWSIEHPECFWNEIIDFFDLEITNRGRILGDPRPPRAEWMPGALLSYAEHALRHDSGNPALIGVSQTRPRVALSMTELRDAVARCRAGLAALGVQRGDRVAAYLPNITETVIAFLATASLGAVWASCPPEFGAKAVIDRFSQIEPTVLIAVDGYRYGTKTIDRLDTVEAIRAGLPTVKHTVIVDYIRAGATAAPGSWSYLVREPAELAFEQVEFDHPLYILFSSGTTGLPKAIVHGHGGILLEHAKALGLHNDVRTGDRFFWHSTTGWMVWNYAVSALLHGATLVCFDGNPAFPGPDALWQLAAAERITYFGTSAGHIGNSADAGLTPGRDLDLSALRGVGSTGSPLSADGYRWIYTAVGNHVVLSSVSGGTDICSAFVGGSPLSPVRAGEIAAPTLGAAVAALDENGRQLINEFGELSVLAPMPSMPVALWGDKDGSRLMETYFSQHPGVWSHGDWALFREDLSCVITGRSDATLNRGGVRLGTSDFYSVVDKFPDVDDSLVVHLEDAGTGPGELLLLVAAASTVDEAELSARIRVTLREEMSPRHVPDRLIRLSHLPRTLTGKRLEKPVKKILLGADPDSVVSRESITWPETLDEIRALGHHYQTHQAATAN
ncbi:acetoacetate--CoA ligase [Rhodococcus sp. WS4]|nr:acetoacetate--CoA ligase [Rhodococcus sp. WS4]